MIGFFYGLIRILRTFFILAILMILLLAGLGVGAYYLLDFLVKGEEVMVPDLYMKSKTEAVELLLQAGLLINTPIKEYSSPDIPAGRVIEQRPYPREIVKKGRRISLTVSTGPLPVGIPKLIGLRKEDAVLALRSAELEVGISASVYHPSQPDGIVFIQDPPPGQHWVQGKKVNILSSSGPMPAFFVMPNYEGKELAEAQQDLATKPFKTGEKDITYKNTPDSTQWNRILRQRPPAGSKVQAGERVTLVVGTAAASESGEREAVSMRLVPVSFPLTPSWIFDDLALFVWDESSEPLKEPSIYKLSVEPGDEEVSAWIPVFGDAIVLLCIYDPFSPSGISKILDQQVFHSSEDDSNQ